MVSADGIEGTGSDFESENFCHKTKAATITATIAMDKSQLLRLGSGAGVKPYGSSFGSGLGWEAGTGLETVAGVGADTGFVLGPNCGLPSISN